MWTSIIIFILGFLKEVFSDVIKEHINRPDFKVKGNYTGKVNSEKIDSIYNPDDYFAKYERLLAKDGTC